jgi:AbrB family looped-hinge helix DNA binding protein
MSPKKHTIRLCGTANIWSKWQIVIPKEVRDIVGIEPGDSMSILLRDDKVIGVVPNDSIDCLMEYIQSEKDITLIK